MAAKDEQAKEEKAPGGKKKLFIIIGAAVAAVVVIVVVLMLTMGGSKKEGGADKKAEAKSAGGHGGGAEAGKGGGGTVFPLEPFIVNIYDGQEVRYLKVKVEFEMATPEVKAEVEARQAPLRDAILVLLTTKTLQEIQDLQGKNQLREEILTAVNKILPPGKVTKVYFTDFVVQ
ncbi:flagellar protein FliL [Geobacter sp. OR-1]|uniref:flagellar basal body-associated FliL family protein n=1 Tax=Geobacter sp. OR-1 TaxID=1266765 RepID=UPI0005440F7E|nr:flagellar basal body-associated FliL family protein [Geobacter sp. OR-1]GAM09689.1 flagellar protein FliL [Geobacter sp. OR-1]